MNFKEFFQQINEDAEDISRMDYPDKLQSSVSYTNPDARAFIIIDDSILLATDPDKYHGGLLNQFHVFYKVHPNFEYTTDINDISMTYGNIAVKVFMKGLPPVSLLNDKTIEYRNNFLQKTNGLMGRVWIKRNVCSFWNNESDFNQHNLSQIKETMEFYKLNHAEVLYEIGNKELLTWDEFHDRIVKPSEKAKDEEPVDNKWKEKLHLMAPEFKGNMMKMMGMQPKPARDIQARYAMGEQTDFKEFFQERAFHGTTHKIVDKFDLAKVGTGEGAQAYGWGLYFAEERKVAKVYVKSTPSQYRDKLRFFRGVELKPGTPGYHAASLLDGGKSIKTVTNEVERWIRETPQERTKELVHFKQVLGWLNAAESKRDFKKSDPKGNFYEVKINIQPSELLLWDEPLEKQPQVIKDYMHEHVFRKINRPASMSLVNSIIKRALKIDASNSPESMMIIIDNDEYLLKLGEQYMRTQISQADVKKYIEEGDSIGYYIVNKYKDYVYYLTNNDVGEWLYKKLQEQEGSAEKASRFLLSLGIKGIKYKDEFTRGSKRDISKGTANYVIFDPSLINITKENGQPVSPKNIDEQEDLQLGQKVVHISQPNQ